MNCLKPIKINDSYFPCGVCYNCQKPRNNISLSELRNLCKYTVENEKLSKSMKNISIKKQLKKYQKIYQKIQKLKNKIKKLEEQI